MFQWLRLSNTNAGGAGLDPGQEVRSHTPQGVAKKIITNESKIKYHVT